MQQTEPQAYLIISLGNRWTDVLRLQPGQTIFIGRSSDNQIIVRDERVSRKHAEISPLNGRWSVRDLGSRNGTQVDGKSIDDRHSLSEGETIGVGGCHITFSHSLTQGFTASREQLPAISLGGQQTAELGGSATIVNRRSHSQWSSDALSEHAGQYRGGKLPLSQGHWTFFYQLVSDLVRCDSPEAAAEAALVRLLEQLQVTSGAVVMLDEAPQPATPEATDAAAGTELPATSVPPLVVLAARQPEGGSYRRVNDFLVSTAISDRQAILARNVMNDSKLSLASTSARHDVLSVICAPLRVRNNGERVIGLLHVYSCGEERMLTDMDLDLTVGVADNLAIALSHHQTAARLSESLEQSRRRIDQLQEQLELSSEMIGRSSALRLVRQQIQRAGPTQATVLVRGESGVGKELVARAIHNASPRKDGPMICLNCAALAPTLLESELFGHEKGAFTGATDRKIGKFEAANGGTLLLDEIGEMPVELQAKFLRVLEGQAFERLGGHKPIQTDVRVIAATNRDLEQAVQEKLFRADLYFRLRVIEIDVPPLRERLEDIPDLAAHFLQQLRQHAGRRLLGIESAALRVLSQHSWPGNIRELRNVIERAIVLGNSSEIRVEDLNLSSLGITTGGNLAGVSSGSENAPAAFEPCSLAVLERAHIHATLEHVAGNKTRAAQLLGIERSTLDRKLKRYSEDDKSP